MAPVAQDSNSSLRTLLRHRCVWQEKRALRKVYESYFRTMLQACGPNRPIVELGSGPGFFKAFYPEAIATDVESTPWIDLVADGCTLPMRAESVGSFVMMDVFHHLADPVGFLEQAARALRVGGRIVMLEPWTSPLGFLFYRHVHHEDADRTVDPRAPFAHGKSAFDGNAALPELYFKNKQRLAKRMEHAETLQMSSLELLPSASWLLTGGFRPYGLLPANAVPLARCLDWLLRPLAPLCALRALIVLERRAGAIHECASETVPRDTAQPAVTSFDGTGVTS